MRFSASGKSTRRVHFLLALVGALSMLLMPVDYRGGAAVSHPHATIQLIADLAGGSLDHHADTSVQHDHPPARSVWSPLGALTEGLITPDLALTVERHSPARHTAATIAALSSLASNDLIVAPAPDPDLLTPWSTLTGQYVLYALVLPPVMLLAWNVGHGRCEQRPARAWQGVLTPPEPPPPR